MKAMGLIDQGIRTWLGSRLDPDAANRVMSQVEAARRAGLKQPWLNRYINGEGEATIDEVVRLLAVVAGADLPDAIDEFANRLLQAWKQIPKERQEAAVKFFEFYAREQAEQHQGLAQTTVRTPLAAKNKGRGKRRAGVGRD